MCIFQFPLTFCPHKKEQNCYRKTRFRASKYTKNAFAAGAPPQTQLGELIALPRSLSWILEGGLGGEGKERGKEGEGRGKGGEEVVYPELK